MCLTKWTGFLQKAATYHLQPKMGPGTSCTAILPAALFRQANLNLEGSIASILACTAACGWVCKGDLACAGRKGSAAKVLLLEAASAHADGSWLQQGFRSPKPTSPRAEPYPIGWVRQLPSPHRTIKLKIP